MRQLYITTHICQTIVTVPFLLFQSCFNLFYAEEERSLSALFIILFEFFDRGFRLVFTSCTAETITGANFA